MNTFVLGMCAAGTRANAETIATELVEQRLAACVQLHPIESIYRWNGAVQTGAEIALQIKTTAARVPEVEALIHRLHTYDVPEIAWIELTGGSPAYLAWIAESVTPAAP